eukprot:TRINITY_DN4084_c0_g1_i1.p1 TRINITY_DN4084_c0_g1~~TRINITY_DN4084_c0_g1_i1.p1  ORF type:complete len:503 (+),score=152.75 TRINITY_DN4084_c0_g1_i1:42-1511(+)
MPAPRTVGPALDGWGDSDSSVDEEEIRAEAARRVAAGLRRPVSRPRRATPELVPASPDSGVGLFPAAASTDVHGAPREPSQQPASGQFAAPERRLRRAAVTPPPVKSPGRRMWEAERADRASAEERQQKLWQFRKALNDAERRRTQLRRQLPGAQAPRSPGYAWRPPYAGMGVWGPPQPQPGSGPPPSSPSASAAAAVAAAAAGRRAAEHRRQRCRSAPSAARRGGGGALQRRTPRCADFSEWLRMKEVRSRTQESLAQQQRHADAMAERRRFEDRLRMHAASLGRQASALLPQPERSPGRRLKSRSPGRRLKSPSGRRPQRPTSPLLRQRSPSGRSMDSRHSPTSESCSVASELLRRAHRKRGPSSASDGVRLRVLFSGADENGDGWVSEEQATALAARHFSGREHSVAAAFRSADAEGAGSLDFEGFAHFWRQLAAATPLSPQSAVSVAPTDATHRSALERQIDELQRQQRDQERTIRQLMDIVGRT